MVAKYAAPLVMVLALSGGLAGCASTAETMSDDDLAALTEAVKNAEAAAMEAKNEATKAAQMAAEAKQAAADAQATANATDEKLNRAFKKSMYK
ncbi:MAG: Lpp/OprI family alanine-zipper lipoprotein [Pseudomonadota bacterium]|nr:Lpp/OprI family alanine-zipper lipoprotein [Pseudomonadota bacterium]